MVDENFKVNGKGTLFDIAGNYLEVGDFEGKLINGITINNEIYNHLITKNSLKK